MLDAAPRFSLKNTRSASYRALTVGLEFGKWSLSEKAVLFL